MSTGRTPASAAVSPVRSRARARYGSWPWYLAVSAPRRAQLVLRTMTLPSHPRIKLVGREAECARLDQLLSAAMAQNSAVLVLHGAAGAGKTALLDYVAERAGGFRVVRAVGMESEMELPFAGLHQLCGPLLNHLESLPAPQRDALATAFGLSRGSQPDRFLVGLAVLSLFSGAAE